MANEIIEVKIALTDPGNTGKQRIKEAKELNTELDLVAAPRKMAAAARPVQSAAALRAESVDYGATRVLSGGTGASGRDFAQEAQGLGGLVRLYATYAANVFAVTAAFSSLREAMNVDNMIKGMDTIGAVSGIALGGLAKQFAAASGGAISLKEAMKATAQATSAGMTKQQFLDLGQVAKGASQVLGRDMSDAVDRLSRGIIKMQPELLDELGLFTKMGTATEAYAKSVGKTTANLTDFERQQAFTKAVIKEGKEKFAAVIGETNPYDQLLASLKNTAQSILSIINTLVAPIAKLLAENSELIGVAIASAAIKITGQALPAITNWQKGLASAAASAKIAATELERKFAEGSTLRARKAAGLPELEKQIADAEQRMDTARNKFVTQDQAYSRPGSSSIVKAIKADEVLGTKELATATREVAQYSKQTDEASRRHAAGLTTILAIQHEITSLKQQEVLAEDKVETASNKRGMFLGADWQRRQIVENAKQKATSTRLVESAGSNVQNFGLIGGLREFYSEVSSAKDLDRVQKFGVAFKGTMIGAATGAQILGLALSKALVYLEIAIVAYGIFSSIFSKNGKEVAAFKAGIDDLNESTKTATNVAKLYGNALTTESVNAQANAFSNLSDSIKKSSDELSAADKTASGFDKFIDGWKSVVGKGLRADATKSLTDSIISAIKVLPEGELKSAFEDKLKTTTGALELSTEGLTAAFDKLDNEAFINMEKRIGGVFETSKKALANTQALTQDVKENGKAVQEAYTALANSVKDSSPVTQFLAASLKQAVSLEKALKDTTSAQVELRNIASGTTKPQFLTEEVAKQIIPLAQEATKLADQAKRYSDTITQAKTREEEINGLLKSRLLYNTERSRLNKESSNLQKTIESSGSSLEGINKRIAEITVQVQKLIKDSVIGQIDESVRQTQLKIQQINIQSKEAAVGQLPVKTAESVEYTTKLQIQSIEVERAIFKSQENLVRSLDLLSIEVKRDSDLRELEVLKQDKFPDQASRRSLLQLTASTSDADKIISAYRAKDIPTLKTLAVDNPAVQQMLANVLGGILANKQFNSKIETAKLTGAVGGVNVEFDEKLRESAFALRGFALDLENIVGTTSADMATRAKINQKILDEQATQTKLKTDRELSITGKLAPAIKNEKVIGSEVREITKQETSEEKLRKRESATKKMLEDRVEEIRKLDEEINLRNTLYSIENLSTIANEEAHKLNNTAQNEQLNFLNSIGNLTQDQFQAKEKLIKLDSAQLELDIKLRQATEARNAAINKYNQDVKANSKTPEQLQADIDLYEKTYATQTIGAQKAFQAQSASIEVQSSLTERQKDYSDYFKHSFEGMADVFVNFAKTGKLSFKDMANSIIADLVKIELNLLIMDKVKAAGGVMSMINSALGIKTKPSDTGDFNTGDFNTVIPQDIMVAAKGGAWDVGVQKFAKGGSFTNSVVNSPTLFKFAQGTGLMGEAGPEAIMPLKRDSNGSLGVANHGGGKVDVVVNNFSTQQATTKETVDSRGNRKIEVVIGDMVAQQLATPGSTAQQSMSNTFGAKPMMTRR